MPRWPGAGSGPGAAAQARPYDRPATATKGPQEHRCAPDRAASPTVHCMDPRPRIALLIDADNSSAKKIDLILNELSGYGETSIRRAYGNWTKPGLRPWAALL